MGETGRGKAFKGSQKWLQVLVNSCPGRLNEEITNQLPGSPNKIDWRAPLASNAYKEPKDKEFLERLRGSKFLKKPLPTLPELYGFWPAGGPHWDALGVSDKGQLLLLEAKSHISELVSSCSANDPHSISKINRAFDSTKQGIGTKEALEVDWSIGVYQYANRLAHLYFLHRIHGLDAFLILLCFLNDTAVKSPGTFVPATRSEWESAFILQERLMGIRQRHSLSRRVIHAFIDVNSIPNGN